MMWEVFKDEIDKIENPGIKDLTKWHLDRTSAHFYTDPASFSGKYHAGESRVEHIKRAFKVGEELIILYATTPLESDCARAAILLHDCGAFNDGGHVNKNHGERMADYIEINEFGRPAIHNSSKADIADAVRYHMSWWGVESVDWRMQNYITQIVVLADYLSTRRGFEVK